MPVRLTLLGRSSLLLLTEALANGICWAVAAILFAPKPETRSVLSLALLAWTLGLRHALDADHIRYFKVYAQSGATADFPSAIDNATRGLINLGQLPVTCGLFFSLGHSTIVLVVTIAITISSNVYEKMHGVGEVGGIVGAAVSGSFLFIVGLANTVILWKIIKRRRDEQKQPVCVKPTTDTKENEHKEKHAHRTLTMKVIGSSLTFFNRPWKMYPVGVLFGFGFDTASSIALLAISAIAKRDSNGKSIPSSHVVILPLLFTAGMSLVDSVDSVIMLYSYTAFPDKSWRFLDNTPSKAAPETGKECDTTNEDRDVEKEIEVPNTVDDGRRTAESRAKLNLMSGLSIILTVMSIIVAFTISLITIMGLIGENCTKCIEAAEAEDGGGLTGRWWRAWAVAGKQSGWIGIGIVGGFVFTVATWYIVRWMYRQRGTLPTHRRC